MRRDRMRRDRMRRDRMRRDRMRRDRMRREMSLHPPDYLHRRNHATLMFVRPW